ncbi:MAG: UDP-N-acetylmuramate dehydrogenase [Polyangiaceae bacterium]
MEFATEVALAPLTTLGVGGVADHFVRVGTLEELTEALEWAERQRLPVHLLGGGSNVVVDDDGVPGLVVQVALTGIRWEDQGNQVLVNAGAGESWDGLVARATEKGLAGIECLSGIPGCVGATPIQNVGAYGQDVSETIENVTCYDREEREVVHLSRRQCEFSYRDSMFKRRRDDRFVVLSVSYRLRRQGSPAVRYPELSKTLSARGMSAPTLQQVRDCVLELRRSKSMVVDAADPMSKSCGSFFLNPVVDAALAEQVARAAKAGKDMPAFPEPDGRVKLSAAWLIERSGCEKGLQHGSAQISDKHALALVAGAAGTASDVLALAAIIRERVAEQFGVELVREPSLWGRQRT